MTAPPSRWALVVALWCVAASMTRAQQELVPGDELRVELAAGAELRLELPAPRDVAFTLVGLSAADDLRLQLLAADGRQLDATSDGWFGGHARLSVPAGAQPVQAVAGVEVGGWVSLRLLRGDVPPPSAAGQALEQALLSELEAERALGEGDDVAAWIALLNAGNLWYLSEEFVHASRALERCRALSPPPPGFAVQEAAVPILLGASRVALADSAVAEPLLIDGLARARAVEHAGLELLALSALADVAREAGALSLARERLAAATALAQAQGDELNRLRMSSRLAMVELDEGDHVEARRLLVAALDDAWRLGDGVLVSDLTVSLSDVLRRRGEFAAALDLLTPLAAYELPDRQRLSVLGEIGLACREAGDPEGARRALSQCLELSVRVADPVLRLRVLLALAEALAQLHEDGQVDRLLDEAADLAATLGSERELSTSLQIRAIILARRALRVGAGSAGGAVTTRSEPGDAGAPSDDDEALDALLQALAFAERLGDQGVAGRLASHLATLLFDRGQLGQALAWAERQLAFARRAGDLPSEAVAMGNLAEITEALGRADEAWQHITAAEAVCRRGADWAGLVYVLLMRSQLALRSGDLTLAAAALDEAGQRLDAPGLLSLDPDEASRVRSQHSPGRWGRLSQDLVAARLAREDDPEARRALILEGFLTLSASQARGLMEGLEARRASDDPADAERRDVRRERARLLADRFGAEHQLMLRREAGVGAAELAALESRLAVVSAELEAVESTLWALEPAARVALRPQGLTPAELADGVLAPGSLLIDFVAGSEHLFAYTVLDGALSLHDLGPAEPLVAQVDRFVAGLSRPEALADVATIAREGRALYGDLLAPLLPPGEHELVIVPTPELAALPFEALVVDHEASPRSVSALRFVLQERPVSYGPSVPVLGLLGRGGPSPPGPRWQRLLVLADPDYADGDGLAELPGTRLEAEALRAAWERMGGAAADLEQHLGREARREVLRGDLSGVDLLHLAAHGHLEADPRLSGLMLSSAEGRADLLSLAEVMELDLDLELVVLSACDTARGAIRRGEGVQSLARAFVHAGARHVVASLWQVSDASTARLMAALYAGALGEGLTPAAALRQAQLSLLAGQDLTPSVAPDAGAGDDVVAGLRGRPLVDRGASVSRSGHPYTWAAFIHCGLPR